MIYLGDITEENWREDLKVSESQKKYVSDRANLLARAYAYRKHRSHAKIIYSDDTPVGMVLFYDWEEGCAYDISQLFIDERYQGKGYGTAAVKLVLQWMLEDEKFDKVILCYIEGNTEAEKMYQKLGFYHTGEADGNEIIMCRKLR